MLIVGLLGTLALAASVPHNADQPATAPRKLLSFPVSHARHDKAGSYAHRAVRRQNDLEADSAAFNQSSIQYLVELELGSPGQSVKIAIDTGSSELWVNPNCRIVPYDEEAECLASGTYNPKNSTSADFYKNKDYPFEYEEGNVYVKYYHDNITLPDQDINLTDVQFGVADESHYLGHGILGLSFGKAKDNMEYNSFVEELVEQGKIDTHTVGVALGAKDADGAMLSFGAVDTKKFAGDLHTAQVLDPQHGEDTWR